MLLGIFVSSKAFTRYIFSCSIQYIIIPWYAPDFALMSCFGIKLTFPRRWLSRVPGTQSRRPSSLNGPRPFGHVQLRYGTGKEIHGV